MIAPLHTAPDALLLVVGLVTGLATLAGGYLALRFRDSIDRFLGFSCGAVIGVALLDLLPESQRLAATSNPALAPTVVMVLGFALYFALDRTLAVVTAQDAGHRGHLGPASLTLHSLVDGIGIGLAFQVSSAAGVVVAVAVLAHDMLDGVNTVALSLSGTGSPTKARAWLWADAAAPIVGIVIARLVPAPPQVLALLMALFAGFFLYVGAAELLPRAHTQRPRLSTVAATLAGLGLIYVVVRLAGG